MDIMKDHNIGIVVLTSSEDELIAGGGNSCVTPSNVYIYNDKHVIKRYWGYIKVDLMITLGTSEIENFL